MEIWKSVVGYEGLYEVSNYGQVRSLTRLINNTACNGTKCKRIQRGRILKNYINTGGYYQIFLNNNVKKNVRVHSLVAQAFIGPRPKGLTINHKDGIKTNNYPSNLEYISIGENNRHAFKTGLNLGPQGAKNGLSKLTIKAVKHIREMYPHKSQKELAYVYGVNQSEISRAINRKSWKHVN